MNFDKKLELISKTAHYINRMKELNSTCNGKQSNVRERRQIDSVLMTTTDFAFKKLQENILNEKINELEHLNVKKLSPASESEYCF